MPLATIAEIQGSGCGGGVVGDDDGEDLGLGGWQAVKDAGLPRRGHGSVGDGRRFVLSAGRAAEERSRSRLANRGYLRGEHISLLI